MGKTHQRLHASVLALSCVLALGGRADQTDAAIYRDRSGATWVDEHIGLTLATQRAELGSARAGRISAIHVASGDQVERGQLLFELDHGVEALELKRLELEASQRADLELALARAEKADAEAARAEELAAIEIDSEARVINAIADAKIARAEIARARDRMALSALRRDEARARVDRFKIRSPIDGRVEVLHHQVGESLDALEPVISIVGLDELLVEFSCPVSALPDWRVGTTATLRTQRQNLLPEEEPAAEGHVVFVGRQADVASQTVKVRLQLDNREGSLLVGQKVFISRAPQLRFAPSPTLETGK